MEKDIDKIRRDIIFTVGLQGEEFTFHSTWGLFSPTEIDDGTRFLLEYVEVAPGSAILDIGCGYGALGIPLAKRLMRMSVSEKIPPGSSEAMRDDEAVSASQGSRVGMMHMIDKDFVAVEYAKKNAALNHVRNCETYLSNGFSNVPDVKYDLIVSNLPAKVGREFFWLLLHDAKAHLKPGGAIYVVTISGLREFIKRNFNEVFGNYEKVKQGKTYTVGKAVNRA